MSKATELANYSAVKLQLSELVLIDILPPVDYSEDDHGGESWGNQLCSGAVDDTPLYAPDFDGTYSGDARGINVLVLRSDLEWWINSAKALGCECQLHDAIADQHYGDNHWSGIDLVSVPGLSGTEVYWISNDRV